jgi:hypothetical protein
MFARACVIDHEFIAAPFRTMYMAYIVFGGSFVNLGKAATQAIG